MDTTTLAEAVVLSGTSVTLVTELMKSKYFPVPAQKYPRLTSIVLATIASAYEVWQYNQNHAVQLNWANGVAMGFLTLLVSAMTYNHIIKGV